MCCLSCVGVNGDREVSTLLGPGQSSHSHSRHFHSALLLLCESQICVRSITGKDIGVALAKNMMAEGLSFCCLAHTLVYIYSACATYIHTYIYTYIHTHTHTYIHTYTYSHTYIHTYIHTYTHTYIIYFCIVYHTRQMQGVIIISWVT